MGVRSVLGVDPMELAWKLTRDDGEKLRIGDAQRALDMYHEASARHIVREFWQIFPQGRRQKYEPYAKLAQGFSVYRRLIDEQARSVYAPPPIRTVYRSARSPGDPGKRTPSPSTQPIFQDIVDRMRYDARLDLACRLLHVEGAIALHPRISPRLGPVLDVITPTVLWVIPDPDDPTRELGVIYQRAAAISTNGTRERVFGYWDDEQAFLFSERGQYVEGGITGADGKRATLLDETNGHPGVIPFVIVHRYERSGSYWDTTSGRNLIAADLARGVIGAMALRLHKTQGHQQTAIKGDIPADQPLDDENPIKLGVDGDIIPVLNQSDPTKHLATMESLALSVAANYGISREQMNAALGVELADATGLLERRAEAIRVMRETENRLFALLIKLTSGTEWQLPEDSKLAIDFAEISAKADRATQLQIRQTEIGQGTRNYLDNVREDNAEITTEEEAEAELEHNLEINSKWVEKMRALNMARENNVAQPGQSAAQNGAMGTAVRDGQMTKDQAATKAQSKALGAAISEK